jgi:hypothetical protein
MSEEILIRGRRQFLRGLGGTLLAVPFLPSLLPRTASAQTAAAATQRRFFINMSTPNGGTWFENMFPADSMLTESSTYAGRTIRRGDLKATVSGSTASLSPVLSAAATKLTPRLLGKMNIVAGFDMPRPLGHHTGGYLGNYARNDSSTYGKGKEIPTLDQVMSYSSSFYPDLGGILMRSMHLGCNDDQRAVSWYYANPTTQSGGIVPIAGTYDTVALFNKIFVAPTASTTPTRTPVVDRVFQSYQSLRQSNKRLSTGDLQRLDEHMARLQEIQRRSQVVVSCSGVQKPTTNAAQYWQWPGPQGVSNSVQAFQLVNDVIVAAFMCGTCRIATVDADLGQGPFTDYMGGYNGTIDFHSLIHLTSQTGSASLAQGSQVQVYPAWQRCFENAFVDLISKLDTDDGTGKSLLDSSLVIWEQECGNITHDGASIPVVMAGSAGGTLRTGSYIDYRNRSISRSYNSAANQYFSPGLIWNQWMGTKLQAMGVARSEYETAAFQPSRPAGAGTGGYGWFDDAVGTGVQQPGDYNAAFSVLGEIPPYLKAA